MSTTVMPQSDVPQWDVFEVSFPGPTDGNPFDDVTISAEFVGGGQTVRQTGFYDGDGIWRIRFMPPEQGSWTFRTEANVAALDGLAGAFTCTPPRPGSAWPRARPQHLSFRLRGRHALFPVRHDLLRLDAPAARDASRHT